MENKNQKTGVAEAAPTVKTDKKTMSFDEAIDTFIKDHLSPFHTLLSEKGMDGKDPRIDLATDKIAQAMTALGARAKERRKEGKYGKED